MTGASTKLRLTLVMALAVCAVATPGRIARADEASNAASAVLKRTGNDAMVALSYADAVAAYERAMALNPQDTSLLFNIGRAKQLMGDYPQALDLLERFAATAPPAVKAQVNGLDRILSDVRAHVATLDLRISVAGARVFVRNVLIGESPLPSSLRVVSGPAALSVERDGYFPYRRALDLGAGHVTALDVSLAPRATTGLLRVKSEPPGASISVDGNAAGNTPVEEPLPAGTHAVTLRSSGYESVSLRIVVEAGVTKELPVVELRRSARLFEHWWFWTAVGAAVAGGVVVVYAVTHERKADTGDLPPGQIGAPLVRF